MMFFQKVCAFVKTIASPKQPQSETGLAIQIHRVSSVITNRKAHATLDVALRWMANNSMMPMVNSKVERKMDRVRHTKSGNKPSIPHAVR